ncbi:short-chain dehydrogenase/reductase [Lutimaribacter sp. EGI FJ00015]|uniref:Short-chain dehydrogenase/reductase n=1 Tax=Lutimaribacter degradans TaxID=2945989 RepID=A0ACC5ZYH1_9RHOB|nr:short-chain dehydrogenase/reductase [Lutimaribacter sp. EGI FJ00013]MCM2562968.1 short-chain dehydrogenase/reductase [Lutimaribacter sp. EGI FJ00013]MCO0614136.1 short-chain dehydrogenase/reductase [Lutimaribacter sp. EGI FJ00015]MCO0636113.1 short-chain dehydrogenase/reductase [Lutimaribacter sp. EGI FJ00014]
MELGLTGKSALVTGGSKGIGHAIAAALLAEGAHVTLVARDTAQLASAQAALSEGAQGRVHMVPADLGTDTGRLSLIEAVGTPDILVNNAGAIRAGKIGDLGIADWRHDWELKVFGYIHLCQLLLPAMAERGTGSILNIIGMAGRANRAAYISGSSANAALIAFTQALGADAQAQGLRVFGINPSPTLTDRMTDFMKRKAKAEFGDESRWHEMVEPDRFPYGRPAQPDEVAALATMLLSPKAGYLNGTVVDMDGGGQWTGN